MAIQFMWIFKLGLYCSLFTVYLKIKSDFTFVRIINS
jgi:hypothetical protein